mgnify:CR=1 FL=1
MTSPIDRHTYGHLVAALVRRWGTHRLEDVEDAVQAALVAAVDRWGESPPDDRNAWLYTVAHRHIMAEARTTKRRRRLLDQHAPERPEPPPPPRLSSELGDDLLRMLFVGCDPRLSPAAQLTLTLKILCGRSVDEIATLLFVRPDAVRKRLQRARATLRHAGVSIDDVGATEERLPAVQQVIYLLFTEGHLSHAHPTAIRSELCDEGLRLGGLLARHPVGDAPTTAALMALMCLHRSRLSSRTAPDGGILLLTEQDRRRWDPSLVSEGLRWLERSAQGEVFTRFHAEARIAAAHALAPTLADTPWRDIADTYALLERLAPSPLHTLNRALAVAEVDGPAAGLQLLAGSTPPTWLQGSYLWAAVRADLHRRAGHMDEAERLTDLALALAPTGPIAEALARRLAPG